MFNDIVFLLGAGASYEAGCKLSSGMLDALLDSFSQIGPTSEYFDSIDDFIEIYNFISASLCYQDALKTQSRTPNINIEDFVMVLRQLIDKEFVVPYPLIGNWNEKIIRWELKNNKIFTDFLVFIYRELIHDWTIFKQEDVDRILDPIKNILASTNVRKINFFSLNYDLIFENYFNNQTERVLDNGFSEIIVDAKKTLTWCADFNNDNSPSKINLYKLHGSLDWEYDEYSEEIIIKDPMDETKLPLIIFGSQAKMLSVDPFLFMLSEFRNKLREGKLFITIGYSFHDKYINNLLIQQLSMDTFDGNPKRLLVVDPIYEDKSSRDFVEYLRVIQENKSINDVINLRRVSHERIKLLPLGTEEFFNQYFSDNGRLLYDEIADLESSKEVF